MTYKEFSQQWSDDNDYIIAHTSGSTGRPKEIKLLKSDMRQSAASTNRFFNINSGSRLGIALSADYIAGKMMTVRAMEARCELVELPVSNILQLDCYIDLLAIVPSQLESLLRDIDPKLVGSVIIGGAPLDFTQRRRLSATSFSAYMSYGMTETCSHVALAKIDGSDDLLYSAMPGVRFDTDDRSCLRVIAPTMSFGSLQTNDIVRLYDSHSFTWLGRADNVINSGGIKIMAEGLERQLRPYIQYPFYIKGEPDQKWGETVVLIAEAPPEALHVIKQAITEAHLGVKRPRHIRLVKALPRTANGKLKRE